MESVFDIVLVTICATYLVFAIAVKLLLLRGRLKADDGTSEKLIESEYHEL